MCFRYIRRTTGEKKTRFTVDTYQVDVYIHTLHYIIPIRYKSELLR